MLIQIVKMPYPDFIGYTKSEIEDLELVVNEHGDVDYSGMSQNSYSCH